jgi:hypothetical protein
MPAHLLEEVFSIILSDVNGLPILAGDSPGRLVFDTAEAEGRQAAQSCEQGRKRRVILDGVFGAQEREGRDEVRLFFRG